MQSFSRWVASIVIYGYKKTHQTATRIVTPAVEETINLMIQVLSSGYAMVGGIPGYLLASIVNSTVGDIDPARTPNLSLRPGVLNCSPPHSNWREGGELIASRGVLVPHVSGAGRTIKSGMLTVVMGYIHQTPTASYVTVKQYA